MKFTVRTHPAGFQIYTISIEDSEFELSTFGGQLLSWTKAGVPILFSNHDRAILDGKTPYRGGAPICFPYFGKGALLPSQTMLSPQHGHARTSVWDAEVQDSSIVMRTTQPSAFGSSTLSCELTYTFGDGVAIGARIANIGENPSPFQIAVHCYWACEEPSLATIQGLGERYYDNLTGVTVGEDPAPSAPHTPPFDRAYPDAAESLILQTDRFRLLVSTQGASGAVVWNPGPDHGLKDLGSPDFICLESGVVSPSRTLGPGEEHRLHIGYQV